MLAWVFGDGTRNDGVIVEKLVNMPRYKEFCGNQQEMEKQVKDRMDSVTKQYWPYCRPDMRPWFKKLFGYDNDSCNLVFLLDGYLWKMKFSVTPLKPLPANKFRLKKYSFRDIPILSSVMIIGDAKSQINFYPEKDS